MNFNKNIRFFLEFLAGKKIECQQKNLDREKTSSKWNFDRKIGKKYFSVLLSFEHMTIGFIKCLLFQWKYVDMQATKIQRNYDSRLKEYYFFILSEFG